MKCFASRGVKRLMGTALSLVLALGSISPAMAIDSSGGNASAAAELTVVPAAFSVSVPSALPIAVSANHGISVADELAIRNDGRSQVEVSAVEVSPVNNWQLMDYATDFRAVKVDTKGFGLQLMGENVPTTGVADETAFNVIDGAGGELALNYGATVAVQSEAVAESIARVTFTVRWAVVKDYNYVDPNINYTDFTVTKENRSLVGYTGADNTALVIPATFKADDVDYKVVAIADHAFENEPSSGRTCTGLVSVTLPSTVTSIGECAFRCCESLTSITIPDSVTTIGQFAIYKTGLTTLVYPVGVTNMGYSAFGQNPSLSSVTFPEGLTTIDGVFTADTGLTTLNIPSSVTSICSYAFNGCDNLTVINVDAAEGSISDAPWGATNATINWLR